MPILDVRTLFVSLTLVNVFLSLVMLAYWKTQKTYPGFGLWAACNVTIAFIYVLLILRGAIPVFFSVVIANVLVVLAAMLRLEGVKRFLGAARVDYRSFLLPLLAIIPLYFYTYAQDSALARNVLIDTVLIIADWWMAWLLISHIGPRTRTLYALSSLLFFAFGAMVAGRLAIWIIDPAARSATDSNASNAGYFLASILFDIGWTAIFLTMNSHRVNMELDAAQSRMEENRRRLAGIIDFLPDATAVVDSNRRVIAWNRAMEVMTGVRAADMLGKGDYEYSIPFYGERRPALADLVLSPKDVDEARFEWVHREGQTLTAETTLDLPQSGRTSLWVKAAPLLDETGVTVGAIESIRDVTPRKRIERALQDSERKYRLLFDELLDAVALHEIVYDETGAPVDYRFLSVNPAFEQQTGLREADIVGRTVLEVLPGTEHYWIERYSRVALTGEPAQFEDYSGELGKYYEVRAFCTERGKFAVIFRDRTEGRRAEERLKESEKKYRQLVELAQEGIWAIDPAGRTTFVNPKMAEMLGYTVDEMVGSLLFSYMDERGRELAPQTLDRWRLGQRGVHEFEFLRRDGTRLYAGLEIGPLTDEEGRYIGALAVVANLTDRRRLESRFLAAQKMETVGQLAGGVAHQFNNLLTAIIGYATLAKRALPPGDVAQLDIDEAIAASNRLVLVTQQLLAFSRRQIIQPERLDLNALLDGSQAMLDALLNSRIERVDLLAPDLHGVKADRGQIEQVLFNLIANARDAMPTGGRLTLETANVTLGPEDVAPHPDLAPGDYVRLAVSDTGPGITPEAEAHLFEPFFTTKDVGSGTGLGLAATYGIVRQHGGDIWIRSEPGQGARFEVYLPRLPEG